MIKQLGLNLQRIESLGVRKIVVMNLQPLGCLPSETISYLYKNCSTSGNSLSLVHNQVLEKTVEKLNNKSKESVFVILDMYRAFLSAMKKEGQPGIYFPICIYMIQTNNAHWTGWALNLNQFESTSGLD